MHTLQCMHVLMLTCIHCHTNMTRHTFAHAIMCTQKHTAIHTCAYPFKAESQVCSSGVSCTHCHVHTCTHAFMNIHIHAHTYPQAIMHIACAETPTYCHAHTCTQWQTHMHTWHVQLIKGPQNPFFPLSSWLNPDSFIYSGATITVICT